MDRLSNDFERFNVEVEVDQAELAEAYAVKDFRSRKTRLTVRYDRIRHEMIWRQ
jgi:hypothetical protein